MPKVTSKPLPLAPRDLENLRASGLSDSTIEANGLYTEYDAVKIATILNRLPDHPPKQIPEFCRSGGLVIPYFDLAEDNGFYRLRPHSPRQSKGKAVKYESPAGSPPRLYYPKTTREKLRAGAIDFYIGEGEKKTLAVTQTGLAAVGIGGVFCWKEKGSEELIPELLALAKLGGVCHIGFDFDPKPEAQRYVAGALRRLARALRKAGMKEVYSVEKPPGPGGCKMGDDDFLVAHGKDAFLELVQQAQPAPIMPEFQALTKAEGRTDANNCIRLVEKYQDEVRWVGPWDKFLLWDGTRWKSDTALAIDLKAKDIADSLFTEIAAVIQQESHP